MNQFVLQQNRSKELQQFPHIIEFGVRKNTTIHLASLPVSEATGLYIYYIVEGKFEWLINEKRHTLFPGDLALILPGQSFGSEKGYLEIGSLCWLHLQMEKPRRGGNIGLGKWSGLSKHEGLTIDKILLLSNSLVLLKPKEAGLVLQQIQHELFSQEIGYYTRVNQLLDELIISITRQLTRQNNPGRDFPQIFTKLEWTLRQNLSHQWTVEEMAALVGMGTTAFNEKVKALTGFSPLSYLINIRISEAIKLLKQPDVNVTDIALDTGFYSSQHFSTTFKKLTGYTPSQFRKNNIPQK